MTDLRELPGLLEMLRQGQRPQLMQDDIEGLLAWLTGSAGRDGEGTGSVHLPAPDHDPVLLQMVLYRLDDTLFEAGELKLAAAGLDPDEPATRRRIRFRRLVSAFHPDRFPELADWLTQRSQAVHRAYARFKQDPDAPAAAPRHEAPPRAGPYPSNPPPHTGGHSRPRARRRFVRAFANRLRARFGNDRYLAHKLIGGLAVLALLPVLNMVLVPVNDSPDGARFTFDASDSVPVPEPPPATDRRVATESGQAPVGESPGDDEPAAANSGRDDSVDASSDRDQSAPEPSPTTDRSVAAELPVPPLLAAARRAMNPNGDIAGIAVPPTVDEQLAAMGLPNDTERLYRRMGEEETVDGERFTVDAGGAVAAEADAGNTEDVRAPADHKSSLAGQAPTAVAGSGTGENPQTDSPPSTGVGAGLAGDDRSPESRIASAPTKAAVTGRPARKPETRSPKPAPEAQSGSDLALGPLATHPAGEVLMRLYEALGAGNIPGLVGAFASDASMEPLSGHAEIARHFRAELNPADSRRVRLKVIRLERENDGWRIETDLEVRIDHDGDTRTLVADRNIFWLAERGGRLLITRMESE